MKQIFGRRYSWPLDIVIAAALVGLVLVMGRCGFWPWHLWPMR